MDNRSNRPPNSAQKTYPAPPQQPLTYRHEWKHEITYADLLAIRARMRLVAQSDPHAVNGKYFIRSLYFDNLGDKALREKNDGVNRREKFRIRYYNADPSVIHLEKKSRLNGLGTKFSASLSAQEAQAIVDGDYSWMMDSGISLIQELYCKIIYQGLRPKTIVDYTREPFIYRPGNVRVTFDYDIRTGLNSTDFLNPACVTIPAGPVLPVSPTEILSPASSETVPASVVRGVQTDSVRSGPIILEVKWDAFLPSIIRDAVQVPNRRVGAFSKYAQCRVYG